jgi:hypothetical protein
MVLECISTLDVDQYGAMKLIIHQQRGHLVRSDIIPLRLMDCPLLKSVVVLNGLQGEYDPPLIPELRCFEMLSKIFASCAAVATVYPNNSLTVIQSDLLVLESELHRRLSIPWLLPDKRTRQTLAIICGSRRAPDAEGPWPAFHKTAEALGVDLLVLDSPGHWLEEAKYAHFRKDFLTMDIERNSGLPERILETLRSYGEKIDGIIASQESYSPLVAQVAQRLDLPGWPSSGLEIATNKYKTSISENRKAFRASNATDALRIARLEVLPYPLIIKPCRGWSSEGVFRVGNEEELEKAANEIDVGRHGNDFVIEPYCDGPEVDANLILCDGELVFFEVSDDFPKTADTRGHEGNFLELSNVLPSALPPGELEILRTSLHQSLLRLGLANGFFHLEARVHNSSMEYSLSNDGTVDLAPRKMASGIPPPSCWLIEINPRTPGIQAIDAVAATYGIDYYGVAILFALGDKQRACALSIPFAQGHQYWCEMVFIPADKGGVFASDEVCEELLSRLPYLQEHVSKSVCLFQRGDRVPSPKEGQLPWVAYFIVFSRLSRKHLLNVSGVIRRELRFSIIETGS